MTEAERLAERLEELLAKATPGPWQVYKHPVCKIEDALEELTYQVVHTDPLANHLFLLDADGKCPATTGCGPTSEDNAALIVEAVNALPALITALRSQAEELERLRGALTKATDPTWFYHPDNMESCQFGIWDVIDYYDLPPGKHVCEVECARTLPSIWCAVHVLTAEEKDAMETGESWLLTEHATEQAARAALEER